MVTLKKVFAIVALLFSYQYALSATYYVDAAIGNDDWSGKVDAPSGSKDGPWQSLKKISNSNFQPGDFILLKCGQTWSETLQLKSNGTPTNPIVIGSYPTLCPAKPAIEGSFAVPAKIWSNAGGRIFKAQLPIDLLASVPLDTSIYGWRIWSPNGDATLSSTNKCDSYATACLNATSGATGTGTIVSSHTFALNASAPYFVRFSVKAPLGIKYRATIRRSGAPWDIVGFTKDLVGTGTWTKYAFSFEAKTSLRIARLDFEIPNGSVPFGINDAHVEFQNGPVLGVYMNGDALPIAHHPNAGHDPRYPDSVYFTVGADSLSNVGSSSNYLRIAHDLNFPPGGGITPGQTLYVRSAPWQLDERTITKFDGKTIVFDKPSRYPPQKGYGYYLTGSAWMLDEPGEWHYEASSRALYTWMPDGQHPGERISLSVLATGIDLNKRSNVIVDGLAIRRTGTGIQMVMSTNVVVRNSLVSDTAREGIDMTGASKGIINKNQFARTGRDAISKRWYPTDMTITNNTIWQNAVTTLPNGQRSLPVPSVAAISSGTNGTVSGNLITQAAYNGIFVDPGSRVINNAIRETCMLLDDCGGIYTYGSDNNSTISQNLILNPVGNNNGSIHNVLTAGIYLDEPSSGNTVSGNTVGFAEYGIYLHNAYNNLVENNTLFGNRTYQLWLKEATNQIRATGDIFGNRIRSNYLFPTGTGQSVSQETRYSTTVNFGTYDDNLYSTLINSYVSREKWATGDNLHTFAAWQNAKDPNGRQIAKIGYTLFEVSGSNLIANGDFDTQPLRWLTWNETEPKAQIYIESDGASHWLKLAGGGSPSLVASPTFSVIEGQWYRLSFDMRTGKDDQKVVISLQRGGGGTNGYELIADTAQNVYGSTNWKRYSMLLKANKTVNYHDPITGDWGAQINFKTVIARDDIQMKRVELVPIRSVGTHLHTALLSNPGNTKTAVDCPDAELAPEACLYYVRFADGQPVAWPYELPPFGSEIIYTRDDSLVDSDSDGIADHQDTCPGTPVGDATDSKGCGLGEGPLL